MSVWSPASWRTKPAAQQPRYPDEAAVERVLQRLSLLPPLVSVGEIEMLKGQLAEAAEGRRFILQGGDCAERFDDCTAQSVINKLKILLQMSVVLTYGARRPVIRLGRIAGQFAKPRSKDTETVEGVELPAYRGDNVNDVAANLNARTPDPERLERGYFNSAATLNYIRALVRGGFANLRSPDHWQLDLVGAHRGFREIADRLKDTIDYLESLGGVTAELREVELFTSHEGLLLPYEEALTRASVSGDRHYNMGAHMLWIGERTRSLDGAHIEYFRGISNPIGVKVGPSISPAELVALVQAVDPHAEPGRLMLISRMGADVIRKALPPLVRALNDTGRRVVWSCDPMHGNTSVVQGFKTRPFDRIVAELSEAMEIHAEENSILAGVHFELTGDNVTECVGGGENLSIDDLQRQYATGCDPRLNYSQSMEIAFLITQMLQRHQRPRAGLKVWD